MRIKRFEKFTHRDPAVPFPAATVATPLISLITSSGVGSGRDTNRSYLLELIASGDNTEVT